MKARFVQSARRVTQLPALGLPEVAFTGRSNVGKSSLIGRVLKQPRLVRTSRTPGRTQLLNLFVFDERVALMDLPGYGYAKLSKAARAEMDQMVQEYLAQRDTLCGVVQLVDARRLPVSPYDVYMAQFLHEALKTRLEVVEARSDLGFGAGTRIEVCRAQYA